MMADQGGITMKICIKCNTHIIKDGKQWLHPTGIVDVCNRCYWANVEDNRIEQADVSRLENRSDWESR